MRSVGSFAVHPGWRLLMKDVGIDSGQVLRRAGLPGDLFARPRASLKPAEYMALWRAVDEESGDPELPLRIGRAMSGESFDAPLFAALCSPDLVTALQRIAAYKPLIGPMALRLEEVGDSLSLDIEWLLEVARPPAVLVEVELVFFVSLARLGTRERIVPRAVRSPTAPRAASAFEQYLGCPVEVGRRCGVVFDLADAERPLLTANDAMWQFFEPELRRRLSELEVHASTAERVRASLLELLPSGEATLGAVARKLAVSTRTLQRRLQSEGEHFQAVLDGTREDLARHYLTRSSLSGAEISFLLGYEEPSSFFRAFQGWTGETPQALRSAARADA
ncbi:MAG: AraC family transcriptional regulator [Acidobacteriota bacterium]